MTTDATIPTTINFHGTKLTAVMRDGKVYVAAKNISDALGLEWSSQLLRIKRDAVLAEGMFKVNIPSAGGEQEAVCLPLGLINGWLFGINENSVRPELRFRIIEYKRECFDVLAAHFYGKTTPLPAAPPFVSPSMEPRLSFEQEKDLNRHASALAQTHYPAIRSALREEALRLLRAGKAVDIFALSPRPQPKALAAPRRSRLPAVAAPKPKPEFAWALWAEHVLDAYAGAASCLQPDFPRMRAMAGSFSGVMRLLQSMERDGVTIAAMTEAARNGGQILATETLGKDAAHIDTPTHVAPMVAALMAGRKPH